MQPTGPPLFAITKMVTDTARGHMKTHIYYSQKEQSEIHPPPYAEQKRDVQTWQQDIPTAPPGPADPLIHRKL